MGLNHDLFSPSALNKAMLQSLKDLAGLARFMNMGKDSKLLCDKMQAIIYLGNEKSQKSPNILLSIDAIQTHIIKRKELADLLFFKPIKPPA